MRVAVLKETAPGERRVGQVPDSVRKLVQLGMEVAIESAAGQMASFDDAQFAAAGASIEPTPAATLAGARVVLKVQPPSEREVRQLPPGCLLISFLQPSAGALLAQLAACRVDAMAMEKVPRTTRAQSVDALSSQATIAGYKAVLLAASHCPRVWPMLTTAAGTLTPSKVLVLGAGVAGLQAIATAKRLGAVVSAFDVRPAVKEQVQSLGARFVEVSGVAGREASGGYAAQLAKDDEGRVLAAIARELPEVDVVVTTAQIPGQRAPRLITADMLGTMKAGAVIVDLAAETGGNCELTRLGETVVAANVTVLGPHELAASVPQHASMMYARNLLTLMGIIVKGGELALDLTDDIVDSMLVTFDGAIRT